MALNEGHEVPKTANQNWLIQTADWRDYTQLNYLERICFQPDDIWPFWDLIGVLTLPGLIRLKAVIDGRMVGFIGGERDNSRSIGWVTTLGVLPAFRRNGIAQALLSKCEKQLAMPSIRLSVRASNQAAVGLYEASGYVMLERWQKYYVGGEDALVFEKKC